MKRPRTRGVAPPEVKPHPGARKFALPRRHLWVMLALSAVTLLAYANSFGAGFVMDNRGILLQDPRIREATWQNLDLIVRHTYWWPYGESGLYRPFTTLTYLFDYAILGHGEQPAGYHWINFLLHAGNVLLVYALALRLLRKFWPSVFVAALWAVHPVLTESVTNIVGRADLLAGMTLLSGFLMYLKSTETSGARRWAWLAGLMAVTTIGVFSKESAVTVLGVIALYELTWWRERKQGRALLLGAIAILVPLEAMFYQRAAVFAHLPPTSFPSWDNPLIGAHFWAAKLTALKIMASYLKLLVWPARLSCDYSYAQIPLATGNLADWLAWMAVAALAVGVALAYRFNRTLFFVAGLAFVTWLPTSNLLFPIGTIMAERFLYLPSMALAFCVVSVFYAVGGRVGIARLAPAALCLVTAAFGIRTWARNMDWRDDISLATAAVEASPASYKAHKSLAAALYEADPGAAGIDRVIAEAEKSLAILDPLPDARNNPDTYRRAGGYYLAKGDLLAPPGARSPYQRALELLLRSRRIADANYRQLAADARARGGRVPAPDNSRISDIERAVSSTYLRLMDTQKANDAALAAQQLDPLDPKTYQQLSNSLLAAGRVDESAIALVEGVIVTSDMGLRRELLDRYRSGLDREGCAIVGGPNGPALNPSCGIVRKHACAAAARAILLYRRLGRADVAGQLQASASRDSGCPAGPQPE